MNEQITKLIIEANKYATEKHPIADDADSITKEIIVGNRIGESQRKLAELIVRECVDKIETYRIPVGNSASGELACEWTYNALKEIRDDIKEHFGIEE